MFNVHWLLRTKSKNTSIYIYSFRTLTFNFEQAVIFDNFIVEFSEHVSVIVDKFEELSSYSPEIILANGEAWGNLKREKFNVLQQMLISGHQDSGQSAGSNKTLLVKRELSGLDCKRRRRGGRSS